MLSETVRFPSSPWRRASTSVTWMRESLTPVAKTAGSPPRRVPESTCPALSSAMVMESRATPAGARVPSPVQA